MTTEFELSVMDAITEWAEKKYGNDLEKIPVKQVIQEYWEENLE